MELNPICGRTYVIDSLTQVGVYLFPDNTCLLIDSGPAAQAGAIRHIIEEAGYRAAVIINTHSHADHCGGNREFQQHHRSMVYASPLSAPFIKLPVLQPVSLFSSSPPNFLRNKYTMPPASNVDFTAESSLIINEQVFHVIDLEGHSPGHIGIRTPDDVLFAGDSLLPAEALAVFPFLYLFDAARQLETLEKLSQEQYKKLFISHRGYIADPKSLIEENKDVLENIFKLAISFTEQAKTREEITSYLIEELKLPFNHNQYYLLQSSVAACLSYLCNKKKIRSFADHYKIMFQSR